MNKESERKDIRKKMAKNIIGMIDEYAAELYGHATLDGWCCGCDADQAFMESDIKRQVSEQRQKDLKKLSHHFAIPVKDLEKALESKNDEELELRVPESVAGD